MGPPSCFLKVWGLQLTLFQHFRLLGKLTSLCLQTNFVHRYLGFNGNLFGLKGMVMIFQIKDDYEKAKVLELGD